MMKQLKCDEIFTIMSILAAIVVCGFYKNWAAVLAWITAVVWFLVARHYKTSNDECRANYKSLLITHIQEISTLDSKIRAQELLHQTIKPCNPQEEH